MNAPDKRAVLAHLTSQLVPGAAPAPRMFTSVSCSQCGAEFPGVLRDGGFSTCTQHRTPEDNAAIFARLFPFKPWSQPHSESDEDRAYDIAMGRADGRDFERERSL